MDKKNIMEIETDKKEPKKECEETSKTLLETLEQEEIQNSPEETSKTLLETLEQEEIQNSPYEKAKERYRIA